MTAQTIFDFDPDSLREWCSTFSMPAHTADQILRWVYQHGVTTPEKMTNLSRDHQALIMETLPILGAQERTRLKASDGTRKLLLEWPRDAQRSPLLTETVLIPANDRRTACVSSQVGCPVKCAFCASGLGGLEANLTTGQIVEQIWRLGQIAKERVSNVVFMGMGEPLSNYAAVTSAIQTIHAPWGLGISARRITVSTVGLPAAIRKLATFPLPVTLALSLHAPDDTLRRQLIPWAEYATIDEILEACTEYFNQTGREITFEYLLLGGVNDRPEHARALADVAQSLRANINLIRYNEVSELTFTRPTDSDVHAFQKILRSAHINTHIRASRGRDIDAACGQLRQNERTQITQDGELPQYHSQAPAE